MKRHPGKYKNLSKEEVKEAVKKLKDIDPFAKRFNPEMEKNKKEEPLL